MNPNTLSEVKNLFGQPAPCADPVNAGPFPPGTVGTHGAASQLQCTPQIRVRNDAARIRDFTLLSPCLRAAYGFLFRPVTVTLESIEFRKKSKLGSKKIDAIREEATDFFERYLQIERSLGLKTEFTNPISNFVVERPEQIESATEKLRSAWNRGLAPLGNVVELLEHNQIKVLVLKADDNFDGFSGWSGKIPVIVLNGQIPQDRIRLTALHELGHLLMTFDTSFDEKAKEKLCHRFAGSMLMPKPIFEEEFGYARNQVALEELKDMKGDYGISIAAIMARARDLGSISDGMHKEFCILRNRMGWHKKEPGEYTGEKSPDRFDQLLYRAVSMEAISLSLAASLAKKPLAEFRESLQLAP